MILKLNAFKSSCEVRGTQQGLLPPPNAFAQHPGHCTPRLVTAIPAAVTLWLCSYSEQQGLHCSPPCQMQSKLPSPRVDCGEKTCISHGTWLSPGIPIHGEAQTFPSRPSLLLFSGYF